MIADRNSRQIEVDKPAVLIFSQGPAPMGVIDPILWGLEEEGIPSELHEAVAQNGDSLSKRAADRSLLGVGIGIDDGQRTVSLHHRDLPTDRPLFMLSAEELFAQPLRILGTNAARLVKGEPLVFYEKPNPALEPSTLRHAGRSRHPEGGHGSLDSGVDRNEDRNLAPTGSAKFGNESASCAERENSNPSPQLDMDSLAQIVAAVVLDLLKNRKGVEP